VKKPFLLAQKPFKKRFNKNASQKWFIEKLPSAKKIAKKKQSPANKLLAL